MQQDKFSMKATYRLLLKEEIYVPWRFLMHNNHARLRAKLTLWMVCHGRLPTMDRLHRFGMIQETICKLCKEKNESLTHLFFECGMTKTVWDQVLHWLNLNHRIKGWNEELDWIISQTGKKGWRASILKLAFTEAVYGIWHHRNGTVFGHTVSNNLVNDIIDNIVYRGWYTNKLRKHIANLLL